MIFDGIFDHACHGIIGRAVSFGHRQSRVHDSRVTSSAENWVDPDQASPNLSRFVPNKFNAGYVENPTDRKLRSDLSPPPDVLDRSILFRTVWLLFSNPTRAVVHSCCLAGPYSQHSALYMSKRVGPGERPGARHEKSPAQTRPGTVAVPCLGRKCGTACLARARPV
jgi:hypothetical protein